MISAKRNSCYLIILMLSYYIKIVESSIEILNDNVTNLVLVFENQLNTGVFTEESMTYSGFDTSKRIVKIFCN